MISKSSLKSRIFRDFLRFRFIITFSIDLLFFSINIFILKNRSRSRNIRQFLNFFFYICQFHSIIIDKIFIWRIFWKFKNVNIQDFISYYFVKIVSIYLEFFKFFDTNQNYVLKWERVFFYFRILYDFIFFRSLHCFFENFRAIFI